MRAFRLALFGGVTGMVLGAFRALARGGVPARLAGQWALVGGAAVAFLLLAHALLGRSLRGSSRLAVTLLIGLHVALLGAVAGSFARAGRDPGISAAILAALGVALAPVLWAWARPLAGYLEGTRGLTRPVLHRLDAGGRNATILTVAATVAVLAVVASSFSGS